MAMEFRYNPFLVFLSVTVAIFASYVALSLAQSLTQTKGKTLAIWLACGAVAMGVGIWSMHFIGMLAFEMPGMEMAYDVPLMILSVVVAILASALALFIVSRSVVQMGSLVASGVAMAAAINGMHYIGMISMRMSAHIEWNIYLILASILIALVASFAALTISIRLRDKPDRFSLLAMASALMGVAIAGMHYTGMAAATFIHDDTVGIKNSDLLVSNGLTAAVISTTLLILGLALVSTVAQRILIYRQKRSDEVLGKSEAKFRALVEAVKDYAICMLDTKGTITTWNSGAERITGYSDEEVIGKNVSILFPLEDRGDNAAQELDHAKNEGHWEVEAIRVRKDGSTFWANIVVDPLYDGEGQLTGFSKVIRDVTQLKEAERRSRQINEELEERVRERTVALQRGELQLRSITNAIPVLVAQLDRDQKFLFANKPFCDWFAQDSDKIGERTFRDVLGERYNFNKPYIEKVLAGETVTYERDSFSGDRKSIFNITFIPEFGATNRVKGFIIVAADVSRYKEIEEELTSAKAAAEVANATKSAFLANMSHEIRTPLGAVIGFSELMATDEMSASERNNTVEVIKRNGKLLSTIINDILDLSKVEAGKLAIEKTNVSLHDLLSEVAALLNLEAVAKGVQLTVSSVGVIPTLISTDAVRLKQVLLNIVGNAIKFTEKGTVNLRVQIPPATPDKLAFIVQDTGTGIKLEQQARLFSPFMQADATTTRRFGGTGLGLVLSKKLANALGGDVVLESSRPGEGSTFVITVDHGQSKEVLFESSAMAKPANTVTELALHRRRPQLSSQLKILAVDDSPDNLVLITRILQLAGATVETASNGREGIEKALHGNYSLILMDLQMPVMDGHEATRELRRRGFNRPIIALTAHAMKEERKRCLESGFDDHITKPIDRDSLIHALAAYPTH